MKKNSFIIGREGQIVINDRHVSKRHAEIQINDGEIYLRDLGSTNGTYLIKNNRLILFLEGYVQLNQEIILGKQKFAISDLLGMAGIYNGMMDDTIAKLGTEKALHLTQPLPLGNLYKHLKR